MQVGEKESWHLHYHLQVDELLAAGVNVTIYSGQVSHFITYSLDLIFLDDLSISNLFKWSHPSVIDFTYHTPWRLPSTICKFVPDSRIRWRQTFEGNNPHAVIVSRFREFGIGIWNVFVFLKTGTVLLFIAAGPDLLYHGNRGLGSEVEVSFESI